MKRYKYKATKLIAETFEEKGVKFQVLNICGCENIIVECPIDNGPIIHMKFISADDNNRVTIRAFGIISNVAMQRRVDVLKACNMLNDVFPYVTFTLDEDGDVNIKYNITQSTSDECIGEVAFEIYSYSEIILNLSYASLSKALCSGKDFDKGLNDKDNAQIPGLVPMIRGNRPADYDLPGLSNGLAVTETGAGMCFAIETRVLPGTGIEITGLPSEVIIDSVKLAMDVLVADYNMDFTNKKLHVHFAEEAVKKDGPSAGTSTLMSIYSAMRNEAIPKAACYTGKIDLFGYVWGAVGSIVEEIDAADQLGLDTAYIPMKNYEKLSDEERKKLSAMNINIVPVSHVREIIDSVYGS